MGNMPGGGSRENEAAASNGNEDRLTQRWSSLTETWADYQLRRASPYSTEDPEMALNGFVLAGVLVPDSVLEQILSLVSPSDILNCNLVCRNWKDIICRKSYWKKWFAREGWNWNMIPSHVKDKPQAWIVFHAQVRHHVFTKNFISNHSGVGDSGSRFRDWEIFRNGGDGWIVEENPAGCDPLPPDLFFHNSTSAWTTSYQMCSKWTSVKLWKLGLTPPVMITCLPFSFVCSQMYTARFDCGGVFSWTLRTVDLQNEVIDEHSANFEVRPQQTWETATHAFHFRQKELEENMSELKSIGFIHEGRDNQFWKGHYGIKLSRTCVKFQFDNLEPAGQENDQHNEA